MAGRSPAKRAARAATGALERAIVRAITDVWRSSLKALGTKFLKLNF